MRTLLLVLLVLTLLLAVRFFWFYHGRIDYQDGENVTFTTTLLSQPSVLGQAQQIGAYLPSRQKVFVRVARYPEFHYADTVHISGTLKKQLLPNGRSLFTLNFPEIELVKTKGPVSVMLALTSFVRQKTVALFEQTLPPTSSQLLLGIVFGIDEGMSKQLRDHLRNAGVLHVVVASGMNVSMVGGFLTSAFILFFQRQVALVLSTVGILFYAVLAGLEPPIVRAAIMGIFAFSANIIGRQYLAVLALMFAAVGMLFVSPLLYIDVGFQLSFLATAGLILLRPLMVKLRGILLEDLATTLAAQAATLPVLLVHFGAYSVLSILANTLVLWTVPFLMVFGGIATLLGIVVAPLGKLVLFLSLPLLLLVEKVVAYFGTLQLGKLTLASIPWPLIAGYYLLLGSLVLLGRGRIKQ